MARPAGGYKNAAGKRVPGVTTIIGRYKDSGGLMHWAYKQGEDPNVSSLYEKRDQAGESGTISHWLVEQHIDIPDTEFTLPEVMEEHHAEEAIAKQGMQGYQSYLKWERGSKLIVTAQEMSLVSEEFQFAGTPDAVGFVDDEFCIVDWKTSNAIYRDYLLQLAAYKLLWEESNPDQLIAGFHICRFAKEHSDFEHRYYSELDDARTCFLHLRAAYDLDRKLKKRCA